jgi:hypothetical protein
LKLYELVGESFGAGNAQTWKQQFGDKTPTPKELAEAFSSMYDSFGFEYVTKVEKTTVRNEIKKCPFYEGLSMAGLDHVTINKMCQMASKGEERALKEAYPMFDVLAVPRKKPDGVCVESYTINK